MKRMDVLDVWRSLAVLLMAVYHAVYDMEMFGPLRFGISETPLMVCLRWACSMSFILISGVCAYRSENNLQRGFRLFCIGLCVMVVTSVIDMPVRFGILQLLSICIMLMPLLREWLQGWETEVLAGTSLMIFCLTWYFTEHVTVQSRWLYPLGLKYEDFFSADFYPLIPWFFLFITGAALGKLIEAHEEAPILQKEFPRVLTFCGRHSLLIYLIHQPLLYGLCHLIWG